MLRMFSRSPFNINGGRKSVNQLSKGKWENQSLDISACRLEHSSDARIEWQWHKPRGVFSGINVYNSATRRLVPLVTNNPTYVTWYTCGPTVYDSAHLGHASCYVKLDILQRILRNHFNYNLITAMNITDIDDKIIKKSQESGKDWRELARGYEAEFWSDMQKLNIEPPDLKLRVTDFVPYIVRFIERLVKDGQAYIASDKSVYFDVSKCDNYGKLQKLNLNVGEEDKELSTKSSAADFALWKAQKTHDEPSWPAPWGNGRPGWHVECSTLASILFGSKIDFHAGGMDLRFPHHENEEAQSCSYHNTQQWVNYWLHTGQLSVKGDTEKMSKSLQNTISVSEMLDHYTADEFRMACLLSNYRNAMDYSDKMMETARQTLQKFKNFNADCNAYLTGKKCWAPFDRDALLKQLQYSKNEFNGCLSDDFDTARAVSVLIDQTSSVSRIINATTEVANVDMSIENVPSLDIITALQRFVMSSIRQFGFTSFELTTTETLTKSDMIPSLNLHQLMEDLLLTRRNIRERATANDSKKPDLFQICDEIRDVLNKHGISVRDHSQGSTWSFEDTERKIKKV